MLTGPQIEITVRRRLHLATTRKIPIAVEISSPEHINEQKEQIRLSQPPFNPAHQIGVIALGATLSGLQNRAAINADCVLSRARRCLSFHQLLDPLRHLRPPASSPR